MNPTAATIEDDYMWSSQVTGVGKFAKYAEERIARNADTLDRQSQASSASFVQIQSLKRNKETTLADKSVRAPKARKVYDAPNKGVLWGWEVSAYVLTKAIATGAFILPILGDWLIGVPRQVKEFGAIISIIFLAITGVLLIMDLGRPDRFLNVLFRPQWKSWLSRGAYFITGYGKILTLWLIANYLGFDWVLKILEPIGVVLALLTAVYTAFLFAQAKGRDFWQSPMLGLHMILHALMAGLAVLLIAFQSLKISFGYEFILSRLTFGLILIHLITLAIELTTTHTTADAHKTVKMILSGEFSGKFWLGMILVGNVLPLLSLYFGQPLFLMLAGAFILIGLWFAEDIWVKAPQRIPLS